MIFLDTGYLIALIDGQDQIHARALAWSAVLQEPLLTTEFVVVELVNHFSRPDSRPRGHRLVRNLKSAPDCEIVPASTQLLDRGLGLHRRRPDKHWSLTDCISFVVMQDRGIQGALTYDHHFEQAGFEALLRREPSR